MKASITAVFANLLDPPAFVKIWILVIAPRIVIKTEIRSSRYYKNADNNDVDEIKGVKHYEQ